MAKLSMRGLTALSNSRQTLKLNSANTGQKPPYATFPLEKYHSGDIDSDSGGPKVKFIRRSYFSLFQRIKTYVQTFMTEVFCSFFKVCTCM